MGDYHEFVDFVCFIEGDPDSTMIEEEAVEEACNTAKSPTLDGKSESVYDAPTAMTLNLTDQAPKDQDVPEASSEPGTPDRKSKTTYDAELEMVMNLTDQTSNPLPPLPPSPPSSPLLPLPPLPPSPPSPSLPPLPLEPDKLDEASSELGALDGKGESATETDPKEPPECTSTPSTCSSASMGDETRRAEKARLNSLVVSFSKKAKVGLDCQILGNVGGQIPGTVFLPQYAAAKFFFNKAFTSMTAQVGGTQVTIPFVDVVDVFSRREDVPDCQLGQLLREEDHSRAVFIQHRGEAVLDSCLCLILADEELQESAATCIKILQLHHLQGQTSWM